MNDVSVVKLEYDGQVCIWDNIDALLEEVRLFWTEDGPEQGLILTVRFDAMSQEDFRALPEFMGW